MFPSLASIFQVGVDILNSVRDATTGSIFFQTGSVATETATSDRVESWQHAGLISRPPKPTAKQSAAQSVVIRRGDTDISIAERDLRGQQLTGSLSDGETCVYAAGSDGTAQSRMLFKGDSSISIYTRKSATANGMAIMLTPSADSISITNAAGYGLIIDANGVRLTSKGASLSLDPTGNVKLIGKGQTQVDGAGICIGSLAVPGLNSALTGPVGTAGKPSAKVLIE